MPNTKERERSKPAGKEGKIMERSVLVFLFLFFFWIGALSSPLFAQAEERPGTEDPSFYDPAGKRDPFRSPFHLAPEQDLEQDAVAEVTTPLQRFHLGQLKLVGVVWQTGQPKALIEDGDGLGYIVEAGTRIGANGGVIRAIEPGRVVVEEYETDFSGKRWARQRALRIAVVDVSPTDSETTANR